jgi:TIR domain
MRQCFAHPMIRVCGFAVDYPDAENDALGQLTVFFGSYIDKAVKLLFLRYVNQQLEHFALRDSVRRERVYQCTSCNYPEPVSQAAVEWRRKQGERTVIAGCGHNILIDELSEESAQTDTAVADQIIESAEERERQGRIVVLPELQKRKEFHVFLCPNSKDKPEVRRLAAKLHERGILPWVDEEGILAGDPFIPELKRVIDEVRAAAVIIGPQSLGAWQQQEYHAFLQRFVEHRD